MANIFFLIFCISLLPMLIFAPWIPTRKKDIQRIITSSWIDSESVVYDLWSWDWKVLFNISERIDCRLIGIESYFPLYLYSIIKKNLFYKEKNIEFKLKNFFRCDLSDATHIYIFWLEWKMHRLEEKLKKECKPKTKIISYTFELPTFKLIKKDKPTEDVLSLFIYEMPPLE